MFIICGIADKYDLNDKMEDLIKRHDGDAPIIFSPFTAFENMHKIHSCTPKLNIHDRGRLNVAVKHYEYNLILNGTGNSMVKNSGSKV